MFHIASVNWDVPCWTAWCILATSHSFFFPLHFFCVVLHLCISIPSVKFQTPADSMAVNNSVYGGPLNCVCSTFLCPSYFCTEVYCSSMFVAPRDGEHREDRDPPLLHFSLRTQPGGVPWLADITIKPRESPVHTIHYTTWHDMRLIAWCLTLALVLSYYFTYGHKDNVVG